MPPPPRRMEPDPWTSESPPVRVEGAADAEAEEEDDGASLEMGPMRLDRSWTCSGASLALNLIGLCCSIVFIGGWLFVAG